MSLRWLTVSVWKFFLNKHNSSQITISWWHYSPIGFDPRWLTMPKRGWTRTRRTYMRRSTYLGS